MMLIGGILALLGRLGIAITRHYSHRSRTPFALGYQRAVGISFLVMVFGALMVFAGLVEVLV